jgi:hypothetical protein
MSCERLSLVYSKDVALGSLIDGSITATVDCLAVDSKALNIRCVVHSGAVCPYPTARVYPYLFFRFISAIISFSG